MNNNFLDDDETKPARPISRWSEKMSRKPAVISLFEPGNDVEKENFVIGGTPPESAGENARRNGLAFSAGVAFFSAVVFMLVLGWLADLLLGSAPWGIVFGIVLGSIIGFVQLFRVSSQIFKK